MKKYCHRALYIAQTAFTQRADSLTKHVASASKHEIDGIHDLRVASRRLRAALQDMRPQYRKRAIKPLQKRIRAITRGLGKARELDVTLELLASMGNDSSTSAQKAVSHLQNELSALRAGESAAVDASCALVLENTFESECRDLAVNLKHTERCFLKQSSDTLSDKYDDLCAAYRTWQKSKAETDLHALRIAFKKMRYTCEICREVYGEQMNALIETLKGVQEALGSWNDYRVAREYAIGCLRGEKIVTPGADELIGRIDARVAHAAAHFIEMADGIFSKHGQSGIRRMFERPAVACCGHGTSKQWKREKHS